MSLPSLTSIGVEPLNNGEELRFIGPAGAEFVTTVGVPFDAEYIQKMVKAGQWTPVVAKPVEPATVTRSRKSPAK